MASADYLNSSEMLKFLDFRVPPEILTTSWGTQFLNVNVSNKILHGVWRHIDGRILIIFVNTVNETQSVKPILPWDNYKLAVCREGTDVPAYPTQVPDVILKPYGMELWLLDKKDVSGALAFMPTMKKIAAFMDDWGKLFLREKPDRKINNQLDAKNNKWIHAKDASWMLLASRARIDSLGYHPRQGDINNWICAVSGAEIYYGEVDFGHQAHVLLCKLAATKPGIIVQVIDGLPGTPGTLLGEFRPEPGGWFEFKDCRAKLSKELSGKRRITFRISGGNCNIRSWRSVE